MASHIVVRFQGSVNEPEAIDDSTSRRSLSWGIDKGYRVFLGSWSMTMGSFQQGRQAFATWIDRSLLNGIQINRWE